MTQPMPDAYSRAQLRKELIANRRAISALKKNEWDSAIAQNVLRLLKETPCKVVGVFWSIQAEPDLILAYHVLHQMGYQLALPVVQASHAPLRFQAWRPGDEMDTDRYGIPTPKPNQAHLQTDCLLIPCVGFNEANFRLGYGGGFYDRTLAQENTLGKKPLAIGISYSLGKTQFDAGPHDVAMDHIITEISR
jgi:5,10-methenyltetrahydrofolate synthetase